MKALIVAVSALTLMASVPAFAQNNNPNQRFVNQATENNSTMIRLGQTAVQKATKPGIKEFGRWAASDAMVLNKTLVSLDKLDGITPHPSVSTAGMFLVQQIDTASGTKFDKKFLRAVADVSQKDITMYKRVAGGTTSSNANNNNYKAALQFYAHDAMPMLQAHLTEADRLLKLEGVTVAVPPAIPATGSSAVTGNSTAGRVR